MKRLACFLTFLFLFLHTKTIANAQIFKERILDFDVVVTIEDSGNLLVEETITVQATGNDIRRGIYRTIPLEINLLSSELNKTITFLNVTKNGVSEPFHIKEKLDSKTLYIGEEQALLEPGTYTYSILYSAPNQIHHYDTNDELYWNVTGNDWTFPIDSASVTVVFPQQLSESQIAYEGFIGESGSTESSPQFSLQTIDGKTHLKSKAKRQMEFGEGYTIKVSFPKNIVEKPSQFLGIGFVSSLSLVFLLLYSFFVYVVWKRFGKDRGLQHKPVVQFQPPKGLTPAQVRCIHTMGSFDNETMSVVILSLAVNGYIKLEKNGKEYVCRKTDKDSSDLQNEEKGLYEAMFTRKDSIPSKNRLTKFLQSLVKSDDPPGVFTIKKSNKNQIIKVKEIVYKIVKRYSKQYIVVDYKVALGSVIPLIIFSVLLVGQKILTQSTDAGISLFMQVFWSLFSGMLIVIITSMWTQVVVYKSRSALIFSIFLTIFSIPFVLVALALTAMTYGIFTAISVLGSVIACGLLFTYLPRRNKKGTELQKKIEGFRLFLTSQSRYISEIQKTLPEKFSMYERYLPYAIALGVEPEWSSAFKKTFAEMEEKGLTTHSTFYRSGISAHSYGQSGFSFGSISSAISSTIASSSSSSGSGSSGGGGGGGGGGGW